VEDKVKRITRKSKENVSFKKLGGTDENLSANLILLVGLTGVRRARYQNTNFGNLNLKKNFAKKNKKVRNMLALRATTCRNLPM